ncbi:hypothetical protein GCM10027277_34340 [Pseudoduganella ginsengisoli]|uniref:S8 family serine peptidase n=1 Tax=Pseudoduganella ginsengisoli TaxID=1462440 RepID=A0A6L6Q7T0_9BURK|nr:S8 family serine peptidase [Pseudoduganella ginsengisoli]MTW05566.1 S8 family serine peptidase [Pseudoduganella ginsengisoli]
MKLKYTKCALAIASFAAAISAAHAQSSLANPFGATPANSTAVSAMNKAQALAALPAAAKARVTQKFLDKLLENESNEFIVVFDDETPPTVAATTDLNQRLAAQRAAFKNTRARVRQAVAGHDVDFRDELTNLPHALVRTRNRAALVALLNQPGVQGVYENVTVKPHMSISNPMIHQTSAPASLHKGNGTTVAVIDTGTDYRVADFGSCAAPGGSCRVSHAVSVADTPYTLDSKSHGTNVAAIVASVAPETRIAAIDAFDLVMEDNKLVDRTSAYKVSKAVDWILANKTALNIVAANMSLGGGKYTSACPATTPGTSETYFAMAISGLRNANVLPIVSAGNDAYTDAISMPACTPGAISVGALYTASWNSTTSSGFSYGPEGAPVCFDANGTPAAYRVACFSNSSSALTLYAPGAFITAGGLKMAGTSQAAPHVAGTVALLRAADVAPNESLDQIQARLTNSSPTGASLGVKDWRNNLVKPRLDVLSALANAHYQVMQKVYIAYYGRPADPGGLAFWAVALFRGNAPTTLTDLEAAYSTNAAVKEVVDSFANSAESASLYGGKPTRDFVTAVYRNAFNREPDIAGRDWWAAQIDSGALTRGKAALSIMAGAQNSDIEAVNRKTIVAGNFTTLMDTSAEYNAFLKPGGTGPARARTMLSSVGATTDTTGFLQTVAQTLQTIVSENP